MAFIDDDEPQPFLFLQLREALVADEVRHRAHVVHAGVGRGVDFQHVQGAAFGAAVALVAFVVPNGPEGTPLVRVTVSWRGGSYLDPKGKEGTAALFGSQLVQGGTAKLDPAALDDRLEALAATLTSSCTETSGSLSLQVLDKDLPEGLDLLMQVLTVPAFAQDRLDLAKRQARQRVSRRNDDVMSIAGYQMKYLLFGEGHFASADDTTASLEAITRDDLVAFHRKYFHPASMIAAVSGSFARAEMLRKLEAAFAGWPGPKPVVPPIPSTISPAAPGLYRIEKDVNQGRVSMGLPTVKRDHPDVYALEVMNEILGGSGFTARITKTVRSNEGLAYSAGSAFSPGVWFPGRFRAEFQSKSRSVPYAASLVVDEIKKLREGGVTAEELDTIKNSLIQTFPSNFASKAQSMAIFASDEYTHRDPAYWTTYRERIRAVSAADVQRVARAHLVPEKMIVLVVGDQGEIDKGDPKHPVTLAALAPGGRVTALPLRDPMTMKPLH